MTSVGRTNGYVARRAMSLAAMVAAGRRTVCRCSIVRRTMAGSDAAAMADAGGIMTGGFTAVAVAGRPLPVSGRMLGAAAGGAADAASACRTVEAAAGRGAVMAVAAADGCGTAGAAWAAAGVAGAAAMAV